MRGFLVSFGIHAAGVVGLIVLPAFSASELPPVGTPPRAPCLCVPASLQPPARPLLPPAKTTSGGGGGKAALRPAPQPTTSPAGVSDEGLRDEGIDFGGGDGDRPPDEGLPPGVGALTPVVASPPPPLVRVGGDIRPPRKIAGANPVYPPLAKSAGIQGIVILECTIGPDGRVSSVRVLRSQPLLERAAVEAVEEWSYTPTLLNGVPVSVLMTVTVEFKLSR